MNRKHIFRPFLKDNDSTALKKASSLLSSLLMLVLLLGMASPAFAVLTITPITWNVIGLDSNNVTVGPNQFPVGARVCTDVAATNLSAAFTWNTTNTYINSRPGTLTTIDLASLAGGACTDFYFEVEVTRNASAYDTTRDYTITVTADGSLTASTPQRRLLVEYLISQNRNGVDDVKYGTSVGSLTSVAAGGTMELMVGNTYFIRVIADTATQGYEQLESFLSLPNTIFQVLSVETTYTADTSFTVSSPNDKLYGDACTWENDYNDPNYLSCLSTGKVGGDIEVTYEVKILSVPTAPLTNALPLNTLVYDFSGSSFHYNASFDGSIRFAKIVTASVSKAFSPKTILPGQTSTLTFTIDNPGENALTYVNFTDDLPANVSLDNQTISYTGCGTPSPSSGSLTDPLTFTDITVAAFGTCTIVVTVTSSTDGAHVNTTGNLFINGTTGSSGSGTDTGSTATDTLAVGSRPPISCGTPTPIATWTMPATGQGSGGPPPPYTTKATDVTIATAAAITVSGETQSIVTGATTNGWQISGLWDNTGTVPTAGNPPPSAWGTVPYFEFEIDTSKYGAVAMSGLGNLSVAGDWTAGNNNNIAVFSSTDGVNFTLGTTTAVAKNKFEPFTGTATETGAFTTWLRITANTRGKAGNTSVILDNITITGCPYPDPPTLSKAFGTDPIIQGATSTLTFSLANPNTSALTGVEFSDVLPTGLLIADTPNVTENCGSIATTDITATAGTSTITLADTAGLAGSESCTISIDVKGVTAGNYTNITSSITSAETGPNTTSSGYGTDTLVVIAPPVIGKGFSPTTIFTGDTTTLTFIINNPNPNPPGTMTLSGIAFTDTLPAGLDVSTASSTECGGGTLTVTDNTPSADTIVLSGGSLAAGGSCTFSLTVTGTTAGLKENTVTVTFNNGGGISGTGNTSTANVLVKAPAPAIALLKQIGPTASGPWTSYIAVSNGTNVYYRFLVENIGDVDLLTVNITDSVLVSPTTASCVWTDGDGGSLTAAFTLPVADADEGHLATCVLGAYSATGTGLVNTATTSNGSGATNVSDSAEYAITELNLVKSVTSGSPFTAVGSTINYSYLVTNNGTTALAGPLTVSDNKIASVTCPAVNTVGNNDSNLDPGEAITCTASYTVTSEDFANGVVVNIATAFIASVRSNTDTVTVYSSPPTAVTIGSIGLEVIQVGDLLSALDVDGMSTEALKGLLATWDPDMALFLSDADRQSILDALGDYLDPDGDGQVALLRWDTVEERGTIGFYVYRRQDGLEWHQINNDMLPGMITAPMGAEYMLADPEVVTPGIYFYRLIEQEAWGSTRTYGPFMLEIQ